MMLSRDLDALNRVANDAGVRPYLGGEGRIDAAAIAADPANVILMAPQGGFVLRRFPLDLVWEVHPLFLPGAHGAYVMEAGRETIRHIFTSTPVQKIVGRGTNMRSRALARSLGFRRHGEEYVLTKRGWLDGNR